MSLKGKFGPPRFVPSCLLNLYHLSVTFPFFYQMSLFPMIQSHQTLTADSKVGKSSSMKMGE